MAKNKTGDNSQNNSYIPNLIIMGKDLAQISVTNLELNKQERMSSRDTFKTDSAISGKSGEIFERQLQKWEPEKDNYDVSLELTDDGNEKWDQFETNEKLFGITTDYDEEIYTTALDRTKADFKKREQEAIKIAAEIEKSSTENIHLAEERGQLIDDSDIDEEDRYGAVIRKPGKYVPPNLRKQMEANKQSSKTNTFEQKKDKDNKAKIEQKPNDNKSKSTTTNNTTTSTTTTSNNTNNKDIENKTVQTNTTSSNSTSTSVVPPSKGPLAKIEKKTNYNDVSNKGMNQNNIQEKVYNHFRQFSKKEKEHLQQKKQAIMKKEKEGIFSEFKSFSKNFKLPEFKELPSDNELLASADKTGKELYKASIEKEKKETSKKDIPKKESSSNKQPNLKKSITIPSNNEDSLSNNVTLSASAASANTNKPTQSAKSVKTPISAQVSSVSGKTDNKNESSDHKNKNNHDMFISESVNSTASTESKSTSFKFNIEASEFKPNPSASEFVPSKNMSQKGSSQSSNEKSNIFNKRNQKSNISIHSIYVKGFLKTNNQNAKNNNANVNQGSATWNYGSKPFKSQFSVTYEDTMYPPMDQRYGYFIQPIPYQGHPVMRRPYLPISPGTISYPVNYVPAPAYAAPMTHNRPVYPPNMMGPPMATGIYQGPVIVPTYPTEMIPQFSNTVMIPQQPIVIDPGMIPAAQGMPQTVYITEPMMEVPPEQQQQQQQQQS